ncbi:hypothetical protein ABZX88_16630 [Kitasatospora aureofaciens]|uniref:hypothetical protein n=1 Tax=Kitasatospora aureofaciens TaxID=1894 RepID=UPI0033BC8CE3
MLFALREKVGAATFDRIERTFLREHRYGNATTRDYVRTASEVSGQDLGGFLDDWLYGRRTPPMPGHPDWTVAPVGAVPAAGERAAGPGAQEASGDDLTRFADSGRLSDALPRFARPVAPRCNPGRPRAPLAVPGPAGHGGPHGPRAARPGPGRHAGRPIPPVALPRGSTSADRMRGPLLALGPAPHPSVMMGDAGTQDR